MIAAIMKESTAHSSIKYMDWNHLNALQLSLEMTDSRNDDEDAEYMMLLKNSSSQ